MQEIDSATSFDGDAPQGQQPSSSLMNSFLSYLPLTRKNNQN